MTKKAYNLLILLFLSISGWSQVWVVTGTDTARFASEDDYLAEHNTREAYWIYFTETGTRREEGTFLADKKEGIWITYSATGNKNQEVEYLHGKANGVARLFYEDGTLQEEGQWIDRHWKGEYRFFHPNGNPAYVWLFDDNGKRTGLQQYFHENGLIMIEGNWTEGKEQGVVREYYENGAIKSEKSYNNGQCDTLTVKQYANSQPVQPSEVNLDKFTGNGFFRTMNKFKKVEFEGIWKSGKFVDGKRHIYSDSGKLLKIQIFRNGTRITEVTVKDSTGTVK